MTVKTQRNQTLFAVIAAVAMQSLPVAADTRVGVAATDITPPLGIPMAGYYHARGADGVLDPLFCKTIVLEQDGERVALVALDIISVTRSITDQAREQIEKTTGIQGSHVMISATHAHTGPVIADRSKRGVDVGGRKQTTVDCTEDGSVFDGDLDQYVAVVSYSRGRPADLMKPESKDISALLSERGWKRLDAAVRDGKPFVAIHPGAWLLPKAAVADCLGHARAVGRVEMSAFIK